MKYVILAIVLALAYQIFRIGRDIFRSYQCIDERILRDFMYRRLDRDSATYRQVVNHLGRCERCQETLREIQRGKRLEDHLIDDGGES